MCAQNLYRVIAACFLFLLAACTNQTSSVKNPYDSSWASQQYVRDRYGPRAAVVLSSSGRSVSVRASRPINYQAIQSLADTECSKYGRSARMIKEGLTMDDDVFLFDCVN
jgi:hypothetical protein